MCNQHLEKDLRKDLETDLEKNLGTDWVKENLDNKEPENKLRHHLQNLLEENQIRGADYCICVEHTVVAKNKLGVVPELTELQSVTKMFTAVAILQLREKCGLRLTDCVSEYLPEFAEEPFSDITILHLLTHTSGLVALQDAFPERALDWEADVDKSSVKDSWIPAILKKGLFFAPGSRWEYSKAGFCVLGEIIRRITGRKAEDYIMENIVLPCDMKKSRWMDAADSVWDTVPQTAAGLAAPMYELAQFGSMLAQGGIYKKRRVLNEESVLLLEKNQLPPGMKDFCWNHGGKYVAYGAGCPVYVPGYEPQWNMGEGTIYHEGSGACMLLVNRTKRLAAAWSTPFCREDVWCDEAVKGTAGVIWSCNKAVW
ncbi:MAG: beta-lactamase family protein [Lachnospiraceae bacterium]|nr:beta-lactamase family protein [Lachnospiraceae bacterium]